MLWEDVLKTLGGTAILVAALAWLSKSLLTNLLSKNIEQFKSDLHASSLRNIESFKASLQIEAHRNAVEYAALHSKRAELISELYARCVSLYTQILGLSRELGLREVRAEHYLKYQSHKAEPWELKEGVHTLSPEEEGKAKALHEDYRSFMHFYRERKIYFSEEACQLIESFATAAGYFGVMYQNVAIRDNDNQPYVNPIVLQTWEKTGEQAPKLLVALETEFRGLLGVSSTKPKLSP